MNCTGNATGIYRLWTIGLGFTPCAYFEGFGSEPMYRTEPFSPKPDRLMVGINAALLQQVRDVAQ
jgi:hypothetical protein